MARGYAKSWLRKFFGSVGLCFHLLSASRQCGHPIPWEKNRKRLTPGMRKGVRSSNRVYSGVAKKSCVQKQPQRS